MLDPFQALKALVTECVCDKVSGMHEDVKRLQDLFLEASFIEALDFVESSKDRWLEKNNQWDIDELRYRCMAAEVYDQAGRYADAAGAIRAAGMYAQRELAKLRSQDIDLSKRPLWKQRVWSVIQTGFACFYRNHQYGDAYNLFKTAKRALGLISSDDYPCLGTKARLAYAIGLVHRQRHQYKEALEAFAEAVDLSAQRIATNSRGKMLYEFGIGRTLALGSCWIHYSIGDLATARPILVAARGLIKGKSERFISAYTDVIQACVLMSWRGDERQYIGIAIELLKAAHSVFVTYGHSGYRVRAAHELALANLRLARIDPTDKARWLDRALDYVREVSSYPDNRWMCNGLIVASRILRDRGELEEAKIKADEAAVLAENTKITFCRIDAQIALGEVLFAQGKFAEARESFEAVLEESQDNPKERVVILLHIAMTHIEQKEFGYAMQRYRERLRVQKDIENAFVRSLERRVLRELLSAKHDFVLKAQDDFVNGKHAVTLVEGWLSNWAVSKAQSEGATNVVARACEILGWSEASFHKRRRSIGLGPVREKPGRSLPLRSDGLRQGRVEV